MGAEATEETGPLQDWGPGAPEEASALGLRGRGAGTQNSEGKWPLLRSCLELTTLDAC